MAARVSFYVVLLFLCIGTLSSAQDQKSQVKIAPAKPTSAASGQEMYASYCAACHGKDGKGSGPAASSLKTPPPDLTLLSKNNGGEYPAKKVMNILLGKTEVVSHGNREMPVWGPIFRAISNGHEAEVQLRVTNLNDYLKSIQVH